MSSARPEAPGARIPRILRGSQTLRSRQEARGTRIIRILRASALAQKPQGPDPTYFTVGKLQESPRDAQEAPKKLKKSSGKLREALGGKSYVFYSVQRSPRSPRGKDPPYFTRFAAPTKFPGKPRKLRGSSRRPQEGFRKAPGKPQRCPGGSQEIEKIFGEAQRSLGRKIIRILRASALAQKPQGPDPTYFTRFAAQERERLAREPQATPQGSHCTARG